MRRVLWQFGLVLAVAVGPQVGTRLTAQEKKEAQPATRVRATTVLVDVVVKDKKGRPIHDLKASDFEVYEDGVLQEISNFREVAGAPTEAGGQPAAGSAAGEGTGQGHYTAMVFDRLAPNSRSFALKAAQTYIDRAASPDSRIGIFFADLSPRTLQLYTNDKQTLEAVVDRALGGTSTRQASVSSSAASGTAGARNVSDAGDLTAPGSSATPGAVGGVVEGQTAVDAGALGISERMTSMAGRLQQDEQGFASTNTLLAIINSLEPLPGRKSILYFSEGMSIPPAVQSRFRSVINAANRANVSIYTIDAAGLRVQSSGTLGSAQINSAANRGGANSSSTSLGRSGSLLQGVLETNETALKSDTHGSLNRLADETGGILIRGTNDLKDGMEEIAQDLDDYYLLGYIPKNPEMDGTYREIEVKVDAKDARPRFRKGYFAIDRSITEPVRDYEAPVLALMSKPDASGALTIHSTSLSFPVKASPGLVAIVAEIAPGTIKYRAGDDTTPAASDFSFVVLVRDKAGDVARKVSQQYQIPQRAGQNPNDGILFYKQVQLTPGEYTVQVAGYDAVDGQAGFSSSQVRVPDANPAVPRLSSVMIVRAAESATSQSGEGVNPLRYQDLLLYPNLGEPMSKAKYPQVTFYFTAFPGTQSLASANIELMSGGKTLHTFQIPLPPPDAEGKIQFASGIPSQSIPPGDYALRVTVGSGETAVSRIRSFKLVE